MNNNKRYQTNNFYLAAYLCTKEHALVGINRDNPRRCIFVFRNEGGCQGDVYDFLYGEKALVDARRFSLTLKELKAKLYDQVEE